MAVASADYEAYSQTIRQIYAESERVILEKVAKRLERGIDSPGWAEKKAAEILQLRGDIREEIKNLRKQNTAVADAVEAAYRAGQEQAERDIPALTAKAATRTAVPGTNITLLQQSRVIGGFGSIDRDAIDALVRATVGKLNKSHFAILRLTEDAYRQTIAEAASQVTMGTQTVREAAQVALNRFADRGISGFVDKAGRRWDLSSYAEMAVRTTTGQAAVQGHLNRLIEHGHDLVIVQGGGGSCASCAMWHGRVLSVSGATQGYPTVDEATGSGHLMGPNCTCTMSAWIEGLSESPEPLTAEQKAEQETQYQERQQQRYNERQIRHWKRREAVALGEGKDSTLAKAKVREWQGRQRAFVKDSGRRRDYSREQIR
jgi:hypothetical protein